MKLISVILGTSMELLLCWFLQREENRRTRMKPYYQGREPVTNLIYLCCRVQDLRPGALRPAPSAILAMYSRVDLLCVINLDC